MGGLDFVIIDCSHTKASDFPVGKLELELIACSIPRHQDPPSELRYRFHNTYSFIPSPSKRFVKAEWPYRSSKDLAQCVTFIYFWAEVSHAISLFYLRAKSSRMNVFIDCLPDWGARNSLRRVPKIFYVGLLFSLYELNRTPNIVFLFGRLRFWKDLVNFLILCKSRRSPCLRESSSKVLSWVSKLSSEAIPAWWRSWLVVV